ncbi:MAG: hypothetical protein GY778_01605, partial [bacterium]|nr:hypothetical protein [bacterium]
EASFRKGWIVNAFIYPSNARASEGAGGRWKATGTHATDGSAYDSGWRDHHDPLSVPCDVYSVTMEFTTQSGWGTAVPVAIALSEDVTVDGHYRPQLTVTSSDGTVTSGDGLIACAGGGDCDEEYGYYAEVTLRATANASFVFDNWSGGVAGAAPTVTFFMDGPRNVTAVYTGATTSNYDWDNDGWSEDDGDCMPNDGTIYPGAEELCNGTDWDCDGLDGVNDPIDPDCDDVLVGIANVPLDTLLQAAPANIMFVVDDSGSMDWETLTVEGDQGRYLGDRTYVFDDSSRDNEYSGDIFNKTHRSDWRTQWHHWNRMYYNPSVEYLPWPNGDGTRYANADTRCPAQDPTVPPRDTNGDSIMDDNCLDMLDDYFSLADTGSDPDVMGIVIDSDDPGSGTFTFSGPWRQSVNNGEGHNNDMWDTGGNSNGTTSTATWTPAPLAAGYYEVYAWWRDTRGYARNVSYRINHKVSDTDSSAANTTIQVNQERNSDQWNRLGTTAYYFDGTGTENVF